ncbi:hypothetical protein OG585_28485 [Streptomyces sp. NBC_01340]|uniref:hypothetical protein n=1 Tax=Streptomyces sp. NBC_01340 TaxID=2903830 RepID=UPI002E0D7E6E|nr:hypothetical protein OG585_28485 [Streptomyces sp. NBC_01340]
MDFRHTMKGRRALSALAITAGLLLTVAGCGGGGDGKSGKEAPTSTPSRNSDDGKAKESGSPAANQAIAEVKSNGITLTITSAKRDQGGFVAVNGTVTNGTSGIWIGAEWISDETELKGNGGSLAGASLVDEKGKKKYLILRDTEGHCLCTKFQGGVSQGATVDWFAQFPAPPAGTTSVQFQVPTMPPATLTLSDGE